MDSINRLCTENERQIAVETWIAVCKESPVLLNTSITNKQQHDDGNDNGCLWKIVCERSGMDRAIALIRGAISLGEIDLSVAEFFPDAYLEYAYENAPGKILGVVLEAAASLSRTEILGVLPDPEARILLLKALRELPFDLFDPYECSALAEAHYLFGRITRPINPVACSVRKRHLKLASSCGISDATSMLLNDDLDCNPKNGIRNCKGVTLPNGVKDIMELSNHPLTGELRKIAKQSSDPLKLLCKVRLVNKLFYHCASIILEELGLFVAPTCPLARERIAERPSVANPESPLSLIVGNRERSAWIMLILFLDIKSLTNLRMTARWVRDAVDSIPVIQLALEHGKAYGAFSSSMSAAGIKKDSSSESLADTWVRKAGHAAGVAVSSLASLVTGNGLQSGQYSSSTVAKCLYYTGKTGTMAALTPLLMVYDAASFLVTPATLTRNAWETDSRRCALCNSEFGVFNRRHHCRCCERPICEHCSKYLAIPAQSPLRSVLRLTNASSSAEQLDPSNCGIPKDRFCSACAQSLELGHLPHNYRSVI